MIVKYNEDKIAKEIANLLNKYSDLSYPFKFTPQLIKGSNIKYLPLLVINKVAGCIGLKSVIRNAIPATEVCHLVVDPNFRRKGLATLLYKWAIKMSPTKNIFCYIRTNNIGSIKAAERAGFIKKHERRYKKRVIGFYIYGDKNE